jgi:hypothetical protein
MTEKPDTWNGHCVASFFFTKEFAEKTVWFVQKSSIDLQRDCLLVWDGLYVPIVEGHDLRSRKAQQDRGMRRYYELGVVKGA